MRCRAIGQLVGQMDPRGSSEHIRWRFWSNNKVRKAERWTACVFTTYTALGSLQI